MTRDQRIAAVLGGAAGALALALIVLELGVGTGFRVLELDDAGAEPASVAGLLREPPKLAGFEERYKAPILDRPVFNESRKPELAAPAEEKPGAGATQLDAALTGVILTGDTKIAFLLDKQTNEVQRVKLGQPLEGTQSGWTLVEVHPRSVVLEGAGEGRQELELAVDEKGAPPPAPLQPRPSAPAPPVAQAETPPGQPPQPVAQAQGQPANADEIRKRIEERRRQLREEAQRMMQEQNQQKQ
jgi:general secretion pathway protein N